MNSKKILIADHKEMDIAALTNTLASAGTFEVVVEDPVSAKNLLLADPHMFSYALFGWAINALDSNFVNALIKHDRRATVVLWHSKEDFPWIRLLLGAEAHHEALFRNPSSRLLSQKSSTEHEILIAEDDPVTARLLKEYLGTLGLFKVHSVSDGTEAWERLKDPESKISVVLSDWEMPSMSGIELLKKLRSHATLNSLPFLIITTETERDHFKALLAAELNVTSYLLKPLTLDSFRSQLSSLFSELEKNQLIENTLVVGYLLLGRMAPSRAIEFFKESVQTTLQASRLQEALGDAYATHTPQSSKTHLSSAAQAFEKALSMDPLRLASLEKCLDVYGALHLPGESVRLMKRYLSHDNFDALFALRMGKLLIDARDFDSAEKTIRKVLRSDPEHTEARELLRALPSSPKKKAA